MDLLQLLVQQSILLSHLSCSLECKCKGVEMPLFLQAGPENPPGGCEPVGAVSAGGFVRVGKPHANACPGHLAAAAAGLQAAQRRPDPRRQDRAAGRSLQSHPTSAEAEQKEAKGERLATHQCLTDMKSSARLTPAGLILHCEVQADRCVQRSVKCAWEERLCSRSHRHACSTDV